MALAASGSAQAAWNRLPHSEARPVDIALKAIPGTTLISSSGLGNAQSLIGFSLSETVTLPAGKSSAVILFGSQQNVHTVAFNNDDAEGKIAVAGSADNKNWSGLGSAEFSRGERVAQAHFATTTVKYIRVTFESEKGGTIRSFEIFGDSRDKDYQLLPRDGDEGGSTINLASAVGGARPIYAFPTPTNIGELNYLHSVFKFPKSRDKYRTIVYDLGATRTVKHFAASYSQRPVRIEVFAFEELPEKKDWRGKLTLDPGIFDSNKPVATGEDAKGAGHLRISPDKAVSARYIALRFEPNYQRAAAAGFFNIGTPDAIPARAGPGGAVRDEFGPLPGFRFTQGQEGDGGAFTIGDVEFASQGQYQQVPVGGETGETDTQGAQKKKSDYNEENTGSNNYTSNFPPYITGAPYSPGATLPRGNDGGNNGNNGGGGGNNNGNSGGGGGKPPPATP